MQARVVLQCLYSIVSMRTLTSVFFVFTTLWTVDPECPPSILA
jgi:hypothetical protein